MTRVLLEALNVAVGGSAATDIAVAGVLRIAVDVAVLCFVARYVVAAGILAGAANRTGRARLAVDWAAAGILTTALDIAFGRLVAVNVSCTRTLTALHVADFCVFAFYSMGAARGIQAIYGTVGGLTTFDFATASSRRAGYAAGPTRRTGAARGTVHFADTAHATVGTTCRTGGLIGRTIGRSYGVYTYVSGRHTIYRKTLINGWAVDRRCGFLSAVDRDLAVYEGDAIYE